MKVHNITKFIDRRRELRNQATEEENILWGELRNSKLGYKFRRQHSIGGYILDFYCAKKRLIIEIDGAIHESVSHKEYDKLRDKYFEELDYKVLRFKNTEVKNNLKKVINKVKNLCNGSPLS